ncbi:MAG: Holliday junction resolvase RuvX [Pseudomonadota bacterium]
MTDDQDRLIKLTESLGEGQRLIGIDLGTKTIGLALSDTGRRIATAWKTLIRTKFKKDAEILLAHCSEQDVGGLILGLPLNMDGSEGPRAQATRAFARNLGAFDPPPIAFWDERLSTIAAERPMLEADMSRRARAKKIDAAAAAFLLQGALDRLRTL